jgi:hypothetical protein
VTIKIVQTCNKCKKERELKAGSTGNGQRTFSVMETGWRQFNDKDVCPDCLNEFVGALD